LKGALNSALSAFLEKLDGFVLSDLLPDPLRFRQQLRVD